ncbi:LysR family transcriptional regulator [Bradyrhizobium sp. WD16]|nr:LysR substrate-binding domain-containing protein [Bradyrhizobium sp. WD16]UTD30166.1 LysR family transcriptional regulator [Bradyrhizobium sp. WD16]
MHFDLTDLRLFVAIAERGSITAGAAHCALALASASARIKRLEAELGAALLHRRRRGVELTASGETLLAHARGVLGSIAALKGEFAADGRGATAEIRLLANTAGLSEHLPVPLAAFLRGHPGLTVAVEELQSARVGEIIASGGAELGVAIDRAVPSELEAFAFCEDHLALVVPIGDSLAAHRSVSFAEVAARDFVGLAEGAALQDHIAAQAALLGRRLHLRARLKAFDQVCRLVEAGVGIAVVPQQAADRAAQTMKIERLRLRDAFARRRLVVCARSFRALPRPARQFAEHLRAAAVSFGSGAA